MNSQKEAERGSRKEQNEKVDGLVIGGPHIELRLTTNHSRNNGNISMKPMKIWLVKLM
jgi:hypothetical protein